MHTRVVSLLVTIAALLVSVRYGHEAAVAQELMITNVRVVVGDGTVLESASITVRDGQIASIEAGRPSSGDLRTIDGQGMTAMPGFIDGHKHIGPGPDEAEKMQSLLEAGYTTVLVGGGSADDSLLLRERIESGQINGPRVIPSQSIELDQTPDEARAAIRQMAALGIRHTGEIGVGRRTPGPSPEELEILRHIVDEAEQVGVQVNVHAVTTAALLGSIDAGVRRFVHLPNRDWTSWEAAKRVADTRSIVLGLIGYGAPIINVFERDNSPRFRNGGPWPEAIQGGHRSLSGRATGREAGYTIVNARTIWDASAGASLGYCTDQNYPDVAVLEHELKSYSIVFSMDDIFRIMGPNSAEYVGMGDQIGTLEEGKIADIVLLDGDPTQNIYEMLKVAVVLKGGEVVVDKR